LVCEEEELCSLSTFCRSKFFFSIVSLIRFLARLFIAVLYRHRRSSKTKLAINQQLQLNRSQALGFSLRLFLPVEIASEATGYPRKNLPLCFRGFISRMLAMRRFID
jgi:hypothetical protein